MKSARYLVPLAVSSTLFASVLLLLIRHGLHQNGGVFVYPLDDAYIHLALSRNLALHGVWGVSPYAFSGASSSPGWTLLLAGLIRLSGVHVLLPFVVNCVAALLLLLVANFVLAWALPRAGVGFLTTALCVLVLVVPLPALALVGMEHTLQSLAMLCLIAVAAWIVSLPASKAVPSSAAVGLLLLAAVSGAVRYESCFGVGVIMIVLLVRRRIVLALLAGAASAIGPVGYGIYSYRQTGIYLPFSVLMKSAGHGTLNSLDGMLTSSVAPILLLMAIALFVRFAQRELSPAADREPFWTYARTFLILVLGTLLLHDLVGPTGWLMRYEAYLFVLGAVAIALALGETLQSVAVPESMKVPARWAALALLVAALPLGLELLYRAHHGLSDISASIHDRYVEHLSQAQFVGADMPRETVIANDIGFLAFYAPEAKILDPLGLGSIEPVRLLRAHQPMDPSFMQRWGAKEGARLAILHTDFPGMKAIIPMGWVLVESWCFPHNLVFLNHVESFYAPDAAAADALRAKLAAFHSVSPEIVRYRFPQDGLVPPRPARGETAACPVP